MSTLVALIPQLIGLLVLLGLSGFFSGSETALFSLSRARAKRLSTGSRAQRTVTRLLHRPQRLLRTLLVGNMLVNIMVASIIASLAGRLPGRGVGIAIALSTFLLVVFGEVTPKTIAVNHADAFARAVALPLEVFSRLIAPLRFMLGTVSEALLSLIGQRHAGGRSLLTQEEIEGMLAVGQAAGIAHEHERILVEHILALDQVYAREIMVPRTEVIGVRDSLTVAEAFAEACKHRRSRLPVYRDGLDDIWGVILVVDLPRWRGTSMMERRLGELREAVATGQAGPGSLPVYAAHVVPETAKVEALLRAVQEMRTQLLVVVDEYGGTAGVLTLTDLLEEVVGRIPSGDGERDLRLVGHGSATVVPGRMSIRDVNRALGLEIPLNGSDTISGYVMELLGRLPRVGDVAEDGAHRFRIATMSGRRIGSLQIEPLPPRCDDGEAP